MGSQPRLVMVAGPNGSGKSTLIAALRGDPNVAVPSFYVNADDLQQSLGLQAQAAQQAAVDLRRNAMESEEDLMFETVMSHPSKLAELQFARSMGYHITIHFIATADVAINAARVAARVKAGGHNVPLDRISKRYEKTLALAPAALAYADQAFLFDNTYGGDTGKGLALQAIYQAGELTSLAIDSSAWIRKIAATVQERAQELPRLAAIADALHLRLEAARVGDGDNLGPILAIGDHYILQLDVGPNAGTAVLHDRLLLGTESDQLAVHAIVRLRYTQGIPIIVAEQP